MSQDFESPDLVRLEEEWNALDEKTRDTIYENFTFACVYSGLDAADLYFYPLLIRKPTR